MADRSATHNVTARYKVEISSGSGDVTQKEPQGLEALTVEDHVDMVGVAELTFSAEGDKGMDWGSVKAGDTIKVKIGEGGTFTDPGSTTDSQAKDQVASPRDFSFVGIITGIRHNFMKSKDSITILAMDPMCKLAASRRTEVFEDMKDSDIIKKVFENAGVDAGTIDATTKEYKYVLQRNESDFTFARRLAARNGFLLQAVDGKVEFVKAQYSAAPVEYQQADLVSLDYAFSDRSIPKSVTAYGWDYIKKEKVEGTATDSDIVTIGSGDNAVEKTGQVFQGESYISDVFVDSPEAAKELAVSHLNQLARNFLRGRAIIQGSSSVLAGSMVKFMGSNKDFEPVGYVLSARTRVFVGSGSTTEVIFCSNTYPR